MDYNLLKSLDFFKKSPRPEVRGFFWATRLHQNASASLRAPFIPELKSSGFLGRFYKQESETSLKMEKIFHLNGNRLEKKGKLFPF